MSTVLILGANSDIAHATAQVFAGKGYNLILAARDVKRLEPTQSDLQIRFKNTVHLAELDVLDEASHENFVRELPVTPDVVFSAVGYMGNQEEALQNPEEFIKVTDTNYTALASLLNRFVMLFEERGSGSFLVTSSVAGLRGRQSNFAYGAAKAGLNAYLSGLRNRLSKRGIPVTTILPGFVATKMTKDLDLPPLLTASPEQVGKAVYKAFRKKKNVLYVRWFWRYIMWIIRLIPEPVFKRLKL